MDDYLPVDSVTWNDAQTFAEKLSALTGRTFRLPTEAEWDMPHAVAARAASPGIVAAAPSTRWHGMIKIAAIRPMMWPLCHLTSLAFMT